MSAVLAAAGFAEPVAGAQRAFRALLAALARPGIVQTVPLDATPPAGLMPATAALLLALGDEDTAVWWQRHEDGLAHWLRFHSGAPVAAQPAQAAFAAIAQPDTMPALEDFAQGSATVSEFSTTLLVEVPSLAGGPALEWRGPGIRDVQRVAVAGLPDPFWGWWQANGAGFPQGVDVVFVCAARIVGLPRTTRVRRLEAV